MLHCLRNWNIPHDTTPYIIHTRSNHHHMFVHSLVILLPYYLDFYGLETFSPDNSSSDYYPNLIFVGMAASNYRTDKSTHIRSVRTLSRRCIASLNSP
ncbi:hypothetical protein AVEN_204211-1 [Araneus ventricosus]|uniref:Uncharacterized protein n=1 Tax=Araneus ventricosus TaxID=182803 RepID=A0A4Y2UB29_ARAVE|nr:hypothetical protein AVEN_204211-1 [Araneus ventricosus]